MDHYCIFTCLYHCFASVISEINFLAFGYSLEKPKSCFYVHCRNWVLLIKCITVLVWQQCPLCWGIISWLSRSYLLCLYPLFTLNPFLEIVARVWVRVCFQGYPFKKFFYCPRWFSQFFASRKIKMIFSIKTGFVKNILNIC